MCRNVSYVAINKIEEMNLGVIYKNSRVNSIEQSAAVAHADDMDLATTH